jgi:FliI/YscN family ATPase
VLTTRAFPIAYPDADGFVRRGTVQRVTAETIEVRCPALTSGDAVLIERFTDACPLIAEVTMTDAAGARCASLEHGARVRVGANVLSAGGRAGVYAGDVLLGRALDAWGRDLDGAPARGRIVVPLESRPLDARARGPIERPLRTGIAAIDALTTIGYGQRVALTAGAGVGKTTLLRRIVEHAEVDARVIALVGERGREAAETVRRLRALPEWPRTSLYCATSETSAIERLTAARSATAQAEWLCRNGRHVLLVIDSLTRVANAWRELALSAGEPMGPRGYPASLGSTLARLVERAGARTEGSITAVYAVLVEGDDQFEPVTDALRALLDGHIELSRRHAQAGRFPAIDVLRSLSRAMPDVASPAQRADAALIRHALATLENAEDLIAIGAYRAGSDSWLDACIALRAAVEAFIFDGPGYHGDPLVRLAALANELRRTPGPLPAVA